MVPLEQYPAGGSHSELCPGKAQCVIVFIAPWCPVCEASIPFIAALNNSLKINPGIGLEVIIGNDELESIITSAKKVGGSVRLDVNDEFLMAASITSFPTWLLVDRHRRVLTRFSGGAPTGGDFSHKQLQEFLKRNFGV